MGLLARLDRQFDESAPQAEQVVRLVEALAPQRLLPVSGLLAARGDLGPLGRAVAALAVKPDRGMSSEWLDAERDICAALVASGISALVLKGALLAYTVYPSPAARLRTDTDLLVPAQQVEAASAVLRRLGYALPYQVNGNILSTQEMWVRRWSSYSHIVDLHWDLSMHPGLKGLLLHGQMNERAIAVDQLTLGARGLSESDALLHACIHYFGHQRNEHHPLQWVLDVDLLWRQSNNEEQVACIDRAGQLGISGLLAVLLSDARSVFKTPVDPEVLEMLAGAGRRQWRTQLSVPVQSDFGDLALMLRSEPNWRLRIYRLLRMAFPPIAYMRQRHSDATTATLPYFYLRRIAIGVRKATLRRPPGW